MMKILIDSQIKSADAATIERDGISSLELMERAAEVLAQWVCNNVEQGSELLFFIGKGNNGGDGLAVARMLSNVGYSCAVVLLFSEGLSEDCAENLDRLPESVRQLSIDELEIGEHTVIFDAMLGTGVKGEVNDYILSVIQSINNLPNRVISIDIPSGMSPEFGNNPQRIVHAQTTLTLEMPKLAMLLPESGECCGEIEILPIDIDAESIAMADTPYYYITEEDVQGLLLPRAKFSHKGNYGHALLVCGQQRMMGAAILATGAALRSGCGVVTTHIPASERFAMQASHPSAILSLDTGGCFSELPADLERYRAIGVGCGLGTADQTKLAFIHMLKSCSEQRLVLDADALNIIAEHSELLSLVRSGSVLTPHLGELRRLVGEWSSDAEKIEKVQHLAESLDSIIIVKGSHTMICTSDKKCYFNSSGCNGMSKGGSGDLLTGLITGLIARGYSPTVASILGVYIHGKAGEKAAEYYGNEGMNSSDITDFLAEALSELSKNNYICKNN